MKNNQTELKNNTGIFEVSKVKISKENLKTYVQVKFLDGRHYGTESQTMSDSENIAELDYKLIKYRPHSTSFVQVKNNVAVLAGSEQNRFISTEDYGNIISGPLSIAAHPESIRIGGVYRINGLHTSTMASTIVTPMPLLVMDIPGEQILKTLSNILDKFKEGLGL